MIYVCCSTRLLLCLVFRPSRSLSPLFSLSDARCQQCQPPSQRSRASAITRKPCVSSKLCCDHIQQTAAQPAHACPLLLYTGWVKKKFRDLLIEREWNKRQLLKHAQKQVCLRGWRWRCWWCSHQCGCHDQFSYTLHTSPRSCTVKQWNGCVNEGTSMCMHTATRHCTHIQAIHTSSHSTSIVMISYVYKWDIAHNNRNNTKSRS